MSSAATVSDPAVLASGKPVSGIEGTSTGTITVATFTDPGAAEDVSDYTATINWGDSSSSPGTITYSNGTFTVTGSHTYAEEGVFGVVTAVTHGTATDASGTASATVSDPAVMASGGFSFSAAEGSTSASQTVATFTDPGRTEAVANYSASVNWGDSTSSAGAITFSSGTLIVSGSHKYSEEGSYPITVTISHESAPTASATSTATVSDPAVIAAGGFSLSATEGSNSASQTVATFTDPGGAEVIGNYSASFDWGDGTTPTAGTISVSGATFTVSASHLYGEEGSYTITVTISHEGAPTASATSAATVADAALTVGTPAVPTTFINTSTSLSLNFSDSDPNGTVADYTATIVWGDGSSSGGTISGPGPFTVAASHTYASLGNKSGTVTVADVGGATTSATFTVTVNPIRVKVTVGAVSQRAPNAAVQFSDSVTLSATVAADNGNGGPLTGNVTFTVNGVSTRTVTAAVNATPSGTPLSVSQTVTAVITLDAGLIPNGAGSYSISASFTSSAPNYASTGTTTTATQYGPGTAMFTVNTEVGLLTWSGDYIVNMDGSGNGTLNFAVTLDQRGIDTNSIANSPDNEFIDYSKSNVYVRFDVYSNGAYTRSFFAQLTNYSTWSTTGLGTASTTVVLSGGNNGMSYAVVATLIKKADVPTNCATPCVVSPVPTDNPYIQTDDAQVTVTIAPTTNSFITGGGFVDPDPTANTTNTHGNFGFTAKFNKSGTNPQGNLVYVWRQRIDVGGGNMRDVDIRIKSNSLTALSVTTNLVTASCTVNDLAVMSGKFSVQYIDSLNNQEYTGLEFGNGSFQLNIFQCGPKSPNNRFSLVMTRPDGTPFHQSATLRSVNDGSITSGTSVLSSQGAVFTLADVGKRITVKGAGAGGSDLVTTITAWTSATQVTLATNAGSTVTGAQVSMGAYPGANPDGSGNASKPAGGDITVHP